jgi:hypothetical protein
MRFTSHASPRVYGAGKYWKTHYHTPNSAPLLFLLTRDESLEPRLPNVGGAPNVGATSAVDGSGDAVPFILVPSGGRARRAPLSQRVEAARPSFAPAPALGPSPSAAPSAPRSRRSRDRSRRCPVAMRVGAGDGTPPRLRVDSRTTTSS